MLSVCLPFWFTKCIIFTINVNHVLILIMNNKKEIFSERLKIARKIAGYSQDELVKAINNAVSKNAISKYEKGKMLPTSNILIQLSKALNISIDYFFRPIKYKNCELKFEYRKTCSKIKKSDESRIENYVIDYFERYSELEELIKENYKFINPLNNNFIKGQNDIEEKAKNLRNKWKLGNDPVTNLIDMLEDEGIKIIELNEDDSFSGISGKINGNLVIAINKNMPSDRKRFDVLHELAHLIFTFDEALSQKEIEKLCHKFASSFLIAKEILTRELGQNRNNLTLEELKYLKSYFGASIGAIVYRAFDLGIVSESFKIDFFKKWNQWGYRKNEPGEYRIQEEPTRFKNLLIRALAENYISFSKASNLANKNIYDLKKEVEIV